MMGHNEGSGHSLRSRGLQEEEEEEISGNNPAPGAEWGWFCGKQVLQDPYALGELGKIRCGMK